MGSCFSRECSRRSSPTPDPTGSTSTDIISKNLCFVTGLYRPAYLSGKKLRTPCDVTCNCTFPIDTSIMSYVATLLHTAPAHTSDINGVAFTDSVLATCGGDKIIRLWNLLDFRELSTSPLRGHTYAIHGCRFSPQGSTLMSHSTDGKAILWDIDTGQKVAVFQHKSQSSIKSCTFAPNGETLLTGSDDETLCLWDLRTKRLIRSFEGHEASIPACAFSPDCAYIVSGSTNGDLRIWDAKYGHGRHLVFLLDGHDLGVTCCAFSPTYGSAGGNIDPMSATQIHFLLATGGNDNIVKLWDMIAATGSPNIQLHPRNELLGHGGAIMALCFSPDGRLLASASGDKTVVLWDPLIGVQLHTISGHTRFVTCCAFSPDGSLLATGSNDKNVMVWSVAMEQDLQYAPPPRPALDESAVLVDVTKGEEPSVVAPPMYRSAAQWSVEEVVSWLEEQKLGEYSELFTSNHIDGRELMVLTQDAMEKDLGIAALGHRNKLQRAIQDLKNTHRLDSGGAPDEYLCPITREVMRDPVIAADGFTYERAAIQDWINRGKLHSPMTNGRLPNATLTPNHSLKMLIQRHL